MKTIGFCLSIGLMTILLSNTCLGTSDGAD